MAGEKSYDKLEKAISLLDSEEVGDRNQMENEQEYKE